MKLLANTLLVELVELYFTRFNLKIKYNSGHLSRIIPTECFSRNTIL